MSGSLLFQIIFCLTQIHRIQIPGWPCFVQISQFTVLACFDKKEGLQVMGNHGKWFLDDAVWNLLAIEQNVFLPFMSIEGKAVWIIFPHLFLKPTSEMLVGGWIYAYCAKLFFINPYKKMSIILLVSNANFSARLHAQWLFCRRLSQLSQMSPFLYKSQNCHVKVKNYMQKSKLSCKNQDSQNFHAAMWKSQLSLKSQTSHKSHKCHAKSTTVTTAKWKFWMSCKLCKYLKSQNKESHESH